MEVADDGLGLAHCAQQHEGQLEVLLDARPGEVAADAVDGQPLDGVAGLGHALHLHFVVGADEKELGVRFFLADLVGDGQCGENVPAGAAAADEISF